jgi:hypothetical protein
MVRNRDVSLDVFAAAAVQLASPKKEHEKPRQESDYIGHDIHFMPNSNIVLATL